MKGMPEYDPYFTCQQIQTIIGTIHVYVETIVMGPAAAPFIPNN
jgi:hypothetical protein